MLRLKRLLRFSLLLVAWLPLSAKTNGFTPWRPVTGTKLQQVFACRAKGKPPLYVCQANLWGRPQIGSTTGAAKKCYIPYGNKVYVVDNPKVLNNINGQWVKFEQGNKMQGHILGIATHHRPQYLCRAMLDGRWVVGKVWRHHHSCEVAYNMRAYSLKNFELFIQK